MRRVVWSCIVAWLAGCEIPAEVKAEMACTTVCTCFAMPFDRDDCITECVADSDFGELPDDCFECVQAHANSCSTLASECEPICEQARPPDPPTDVPDGGLP